MADPGIRLLSVIPSPYTGTPYQFAVVPDDAVGGDKSGKRSITRSYGDANASGPMRRRRVEWEIGGALENFPVGAIGASVESASGYLGIDFAQNVETRWDRRLTSPAKQNRVDLTTLDPPSEVAYFDTSYFDTSYFAGSGDVADPDVVVFAEQNGYLLCVRGALLTQVDMTTDPWTVVSTTVLDANGRDADRWRSNVYIALGPSAPMQRVVGATTSGVTLEDTTSTSPSGDVYASAVKRGSDRAWFIDAESGATFNFANYTLNRFVDLASPFQVGDPDVGTTGIGPFGPFTQFGSQDGIYSFTDQGKPVPLSRALTNLHSTLNGYQFADPGWNWNYYTAVTGLRANAFGPDNPVGIGERMRAFTGHSGVAKALYQVRGEMPVAYTTPEGTDYGYRCTFGPETGGTGQPILWPWFYGGSATPCQAIYSSTTGVPNENGIWLIRGEGTNLVYELVAADGRDDLYPSYEYSQAGGLAYLTTLDRDRNLRKTLRLARFRTRQMASGDIIQVAFAFDPDPQDTINSTYVTLDAVQTNGQHTQYPDNGTTTGQGNPSPTASISGFAIKPRIAHIALGAGSDVTPPEMVGTLEIEYDERPEQVQTVSVIVNIEGAGYTDNNVWATLREYVSQETPQPMMIQLPDDLPPAMSAENGGGQVYAFLTAVKNREDIRAPGIEAVELQFEVWPAAEAL